MLVKVNKLSIMLFDIKTLLSVVNLDHQRWIILLNHPTSRLSTQLCSVFFFCCSFLNDFPFLALVVKPVIYLSQRRRKTKENHFLYILQFRLSFCILKTIIRNDKREDVFWQWKKKERHAILKFYFFSFSCCAIMPWHV